MQLFVTRFMRLWSVKRSTRSICHSSIRWAHVDCISDGAVPVGTVFIKYRTDFIPIPSSSSAWCISTRSVFRRHSVMHSSTAKIIHLLFHAAVLASYVTPPGNDYFTHLSRSRTKNLWILRKIGFASLPEAPAFFRKSSLLDHHVLCVVVAVVTIEHGRIDAPGRAPEADLKNHLDVRMTNRCFPNLCLSAWCLQCSWDKRFMKANIDNIFPKLLRWKLHL